jgi:hypothetical protein
MEVLVLSDEVVIVPSLEHLMSICFGRHHPWVGLSQSDHNSNFENWQTRIGLAKRRRLGL